MAIETRINYRLTLPGAYPLRGGTSSATVAMPENPSQLMECFRESFAKEDGVGDREKMQALITLAEKHIARGRGWFYGQSAETSRLECYTLAARERLKAFEPAQPRDKLLAKCRLDNAQLLSDWKKRGFSEEAFWRSPDLVDFVFKSHLHRFIRHADYQHTIEMRPVPVGGESILEPHLLMQGRRVPWSKISREITIDEDERLCSIGANGKKTYWMYLEQGLTQRDRHDFSTFIPFKTLAQPPSENQVQIVTSHIPRQRWGFLHYYTEGNVHTHFRIVPRAGFSASHPGASLHDGKVYSIGYGARWNDVTKGQELKTIPGLFFNPDSTEFLKEDLRITTLDHITDEQLLKVVNLVQKRAGELRPFNIVSHNCCSETTEILKEAGVIDLQSGVTLDRVLYKFLVIKPLRKVCSAVGRQLSRVTPERLSKAMSTAGFALLMLTVSPLLLLLGGWRIKRQSPGDTRIGELKPLISRLCDLFDKSKFTVHMTWQVSKWQKKQPNTVYVEQK